jgi:hypothetical protein
MADTFARSVETTVGDDASPLPMPPPTLLTPTPRLPGLLPTSGLAPADSVLVDAAPVKRGGDAVSALPLSFELTPTVRRLWPLEVPPSAEPEPDDEETLSLSASPIAGDSSESRP